MERDYEELYAVAEERHPWFVARRDLFAALAGDDRSARILDVGCGSGIFLAHLKALGFHRLAGVEPSANLRAKFRDSTIELFAELPRPDAGGGGGEGAYDKIFLLDVLEHIADDRGTLADLFRLLAPGGRLYLSVPAHPSLWRRHDEINRHQRRYRRKELRDKLSATGFRLRRLSSWNLVSLAPVFLSRWLALGERASELELGSPLVRRLYGAALRLENRLVQRFGLPLGVSLVAVAERPASPAPPAPGSAVGPAHGASG